MVDEPEEIEVVLGQDDASKGEADPVAALNKQFEALKADNEKRKEAEAAANQRASAERAAAEQARQDAQLARSALADRETDTVESRIAAATAEADAATQEYVTASEAGDWKKQAEAQRKIARAEAKLAQFEATKADLAVRRQETVDSPRTVSRPSADPFEDHLTKFTPRTADWMRDHKDWVTDPRKNSKLQGAHHMAVGDGLAPDTDAYFEHVEKTLGMRGGEESPPARNGDARPTRRAAPMVAPVNGGGGAHSSGDGDRRDRNTVVLTKGELERSEDGSIVWNKGNVDPKTGEVIKEGDPRLGKPIGRVEYARRKQQLDRGGYYDKTYSHG